MKFVTALRLGRVSNLPTVFSNVLAGALLTRGVLNLEILFILMIAMGVVYLSGMFLNDAFDVNHDRQYKPERPIIQGEVNRKEVFIFGFILMLLANLIVFYISPNIQAILAMITLSVFVMFYNWHHKSNSFSPYVMAICRALVYIVSGLTISDFWSIEQTLAVVALALWVIGLTSFAKGQPAKKYFFFLFLSIGILNVFTLYTFPIILLPIMIIVASLFYWHYYQYAKFKRGITALLIADISLLDSWVIACISTGPYVILTLSAFGLTRYWQKKLSGD